MMKLTMTKTLALFIPNLTFHARGARGPPPGARAACWRAGVSEQAESASRTASSHHATLSSGSQVAVACPLCTLTSLPEAASRARSKVDSQPG